MKAALNLYMFAFFRWLIKSEIHDLSKLFAFFLHLNLKYLRINRFPYRFNVAFLQNSHLDSDICKSNIKNVFSLKETWKQLSFGAFRFVHTNMIHV